MRLSTTARTALMAIVLSLVSGLVPVAFLWRATHDDTIEELRRDTLEQGEALTATWRRAGTVGLREAIDQASAANDPALVVALTDNAGRRIAGTGPDRTGWRWRPRRDSVSRVWGHPAAGMNAMRESRCGILVSTGW